MSETARSITFVIVAVVSAGIAWFAKPPDNITPEEMRSAKLGKPFYPEFEDPNAPTSIRVVTFDDQKAVTRTFAVELKDGLWRIPSRHNYPADGADRLAKTSTSLMGVVREELIPGGDTRHEEFGVLDPAEADATKLKGRGQRITLSKGDSPLLDLIIGKAVRERPGHRYLRRPDEKSVYVAKINPDLSTKFSDWVETNLLKLSRDDLASIEIDNYSFSEGQDGLSRIEAGEVVQLSRDKSFDPWKLAGLDDPTKEVDTTKSNDMVNTLVDLKLTGIRPKPPGLNEDLTIDRKVVKQRAQLDLLIADMSSKGFVPGPGKSEDDPPRLYAKQGEMRLTTSKGLAYALRFGDVFTGSESEIESGAPGDKEAEGEKKDESADKPAQQSSRYLLVSVAFDESLLGPMPEKPERPAALDAKEESAARPAPSVPVVATVNGVIPVPCGQEAAPGDEPATPAAEPAAQEAPATTTPEPAADDKPAAVEPPATEAKGTPDEQPAAEPVAPAEPPPANPEAPKPDPAKVKADLQREYDAKLSKYEADLKDWEAKAKTGREKAEELNRRFREWYYVISADSVAKLRLTREDLIKEKKADNAGAPGGGLPGGLPGGLNLPGGLPQRFGAGEPADAPAGPEGDEPISPAKEPADETKSPADEPVQPEETR